MNTSMTLQWKVRGLAAWSWRDDGHIARKLLEFAHTEAGSGLEMLRAAEIGEDPALCRLFLHHAVDEMRHAAMLRAAAFRLVPGIQGTSYDAARATRQDLLARLGPVQFMAFVFLAEQSGQARFQALAHHFSSRPELAALFQQLATEEKFHVSYSRRQLQAWRDAGRGVEVERALWTVRARAAWEAWRRAGRVLGDAAAHAVLAVTCVLLAPFFLGARKPVNAGGVGWQAAAPRTRSLEDARRED